MEYSGINLPENVIIVENKYGQGYVVSEGSSLDNARNWAERSDWEPKEYKYKNGTFTLRVTNAAGYSSQGGKLSFWNCQIRTEDEKEFLIGISSDCLAELIINNTLINGKCQNKIYFARCGNSTWAITENMPSYKTALEDKKIKETKTTVKYEPGDLVGSLTYTELYLGEVYEYISVYQLNSRDRYFKHFEVNDRAYDKLIVINDKPRKFHWLVNSYDIDEDFNNEPTFFCTYYLSKNKPKRRIIKKSYALKDYINNALEESIKYTANRSSEFSSDDPVPEIEVYLRQFVNVYSRKENLPQPNKELIQELLTKYRAIDPYNYTIRHNCSYVIYEHDLTPELLEGIKSGKLVKV